MNGRFESNKIQKKPQKHAIQLVINKNHANNQFKRDTTDSKKALPPGKFSYLLLKMLKIIIIISLLFRYCL